MKKQLNNRLYIDGEDFYGFVSDDYGNDLSYGLLDGLHYIYDENGEEKDIDLNLKHYTDEIDDFDYSKIKTIQIKYITNDTFNIISRCINAEEMIFENVGLKYIPDNLINLKRISLINCPNIKEIPDNYINLKQLYIENCRFIKNLPETLINLRGLYLRWCCFDNIIIPDTYENLRSLQLYRCDKNDKIPLNLINIKRIDIANCINIKKEEVLKYYGDKNIYINIYNVDDDDDDNNNNGGGVVMF